MAQLRSNRVKQKLQAGEVALVVGLNDADAIEALGPIDLVDGVWIETEHGAVTWRELSDLARAADLAGVSSLVRVMNATPSLIGRTLDRGVQGVIVPHCVSAEHARAVVEGALYTPKGKRGMYSPTRQGLGVPNYFRIANDELFVMVLIEDLEAIEHLDAILAVPGIDCFFVAPYDLAQTMGEQYIGQPHHPDVRALTEATIKRVLAAGRTAGTVVNGDNVEHYAAMGVRFFLTSLNEFAMMGLRGFRSRLAAAVTSQKKS